MRVCFFCSAFDKEKSLAGTKNLSQIFFPGMKAQEREREREREREDQYAIMHTNFM